MDKLLEKLPNVSLGGKDYSADDLHWLWEVKEFVPFVNWLIKYVDHNNILAYQHYEKQFLFHYYRFKDLELSDEVLHGKELDHALKEYGVHAESLLHSNFSDFECELNDFEIAELRVQNEIAAEVENIVVDESHRCSCIEATKESELKLAQAACQREGQNLMKIHVPFKAALSSLFSNVNKLKTALMDSEDPDITNSTFSNLPLHSMLNSFEKFNEYSNLCLTRKFELSSTNEKNTLHELMSFVGEESSLRSLLSSSSANVTSGLPSKMWKAELSRISMHGNFTGKVGAVRHLTCLKGNSSLQKLNLMAMKLEIVKLQDDITRLMDDINLTLKHEANKIAEDIVLYNIRSVVEQITRIRIERRQVMLRKLCSIASVTHKFLYLTDVIWMIFSHESQQCRFSLSTIKEISDYFTDELNRHDSTMFGLQSILKEYNLANDVLRVGQATLLGTLQRLQDVAGNDNDFMSESRWKEIECEPLKSASEYLNKQHFDRELSLIKLILELTSGETRKPNLVNTALSLSLQEVENQLNKYSSEFNDLVTLYSTKQLAFNKSQAAKNRRLLWAWFLVAPHELEEALSIAKEELLRKRHGH
ncbi:F-box protein [Frankliniella fusca]|uniref:F-box protein n=1 Tax=Frankliniella fusca TaxID=407009 RepID=A0AAE1H3P2_9NEOP|nr:F-box protein [Frankliniella fusca]